VSQRKPEPWENHNLCDPDATAGDLVPKHRMNLNPTRLAAAIIAGLVSLSSSAQTLVNDGSNGSRTPLPSNQPDQFVSIVRVSPDSDVAPKPALVADRIGGPAEHEQIVVAPSARESERLRLAAPVATVANAAASPSLEASQVARELRSNATLSRVQLADLKTRVTRSRQSMATTRDTMPALSVANQSQFNVANADVKRKARTLRDSMKAGRNQSSAQVATDYEAYAAAVARVDGIAFAQR
jgi:hypothetical protein